VNLRPIGNRPGAGPGEFALVLPQWPSGVSESVLSIANAFDVHSRDLRLACRKAGWQPAANWQSSATRFFERETVCVYRGADPLVCGRRPRRPGRHWRSGSWGTRADLGICPTTFAGFVVSEKR